jgi:hypothetical protein
MAVQSIAPTASQQASAALHLERQADWRAVRIDGTRYVILPSGRSGHVYTVRADAAGCSCPWYVRTGQRCSHMLALELSEPRPAPAPTPKRSRYEDLFPACAGGCGELVERKGERCYRCVSSEVHRLDVEARMAVKQTARATEAWL